MSIYLYSIQRGNASLNTQYLCTESCNLNLNFIVVVVTLSNTYYLKLIKYVYLNGQITFLCLKVGELW